MPNWLLPCSCNIQSQRCQCNSKLRPDILCIYNHPYNAEPPQEPNHTLTVQFIEFTYYNDKYFPEKIQEITEKYQGLVNDIKARGWNVDPLITSSSSSSDIYNEIYFTFTFWWLQVTVYTLAPSDTQKGLHFLSYNHCYSLYLTCLVLVSKNSPSVAVCIASLPFTE
jgi:hypothetical protein